MKCTRWVGILGCLLLGLTAAGCGKAEVEEVRVGGQAPHFALKDRDGQVVSNESLKGHVVLLTFWSTTCGPCVREIPDLQKIDDEAGAKVVAIALNPEGWASVRPFAEKYQVRYSVVLGDEDLFQRCGGYALPHTLLLDQSQRVVKIYRGAVTRETVEKDIEAIKHAT